MPSNNNFNPYKFSLLSSLYIAIGSYFVINYNDLTISIESDENKRKPKLLFFSMHL